MKTRARAECAYDVQRRQETLKKLNLGFRQLKARKEYKDKPVTAYALSKHTGIAYRTIKRYSEIVEKLEKEKNPGVMLKTAVVDTVRIKSIEEAVSVIDTLTKVYNETKDKYNEAVKKLSEANLRIVRLESEKKELELAIKRLN